MKITAETIRTLREDCGTLDQFVEILGEWGFKVLSEYGCFKVVYKKPRLDLVVKVCFNGGHIREQNRSYKYSRKKFRAKLLPLLAYGDDYQVQQFVKECRKHGCGVKGVPDTNGHNHTHIGRRRLAFDWLPSRWRED